jgi:thiamine kinase-like enzyme
MNSGLKVW